MKAQVARRGAIRPSVVMDPSDAVFECYGNPLEPEVPTRSVVNIVWRGYSARSAVRPEAKFVWLEGLDSGTFAGIM